MTEPDRAPVQACNQSGRSPGTISWAEHVEAWEGYRELFPISAAGQDATRMAVRMGFSYGELVDQLGHEPETWEVATREECYLWAGFAARHQKARDDEA